MYAKIAEPLLREPTGQRAEEILRRCVHCGFCNATCPTYNLLGDELDGPRGRIYLIKDMLESNAVNEEAPIHLDRCLTCRNCETTCPSGVQYGELLEIGREFIQERSPQTTWLERILLMVVPHFRRLKFFARLGRMFRWFVPAELARMLHPFSSHNVVSDTEDAEITLLQGCAQRALTSHVNAHLVNLLRERSVRVRVSDREVCCGGLHLHLGHKEQALRFMNDYSSALYSETTETYLSSASGCGVTVKDFARHLASEEAKHVATRTKDACEYLQPFSFKRHPNVKRVALHNPCTLQHGQALRGLIEALLEKTGYELVPVRDAHLCCGSAGTYSVLQPELSEQLLENKVACLEEHMPDVIATANVGCQLHLADGAELPVVHWLMLLR